MNTDPTQVSDLQSALLLLDSLITDPKKLASLDENTRAHILRVAGQLTNPTPEDRKKRQQARAETKKEKIAARDRRLRAETGIRKARQNVVFFAPAQLLCAPAHETPSTAPELESPRNCYICKASYTRLHHFYDALCPACAQLNYDKRFQCADLTGAVAIITGSRLKIGYQATLMMLRAGATVIATTRFPHDSAIRFSKELDFPTFKDRLKIFGLDLRHTPSVELFCAYCEQTLPRLDILINNAAQTVRRPPNFYAHLMDIERRSLKNLDTNAASLLADFSSCKAAISKSAALTHIDTASLPVQWNGEVPGIGIMSSAELSQIPYTTDKTLPAAEIFPHGALDADLQQIDLRTTNSWRLTLGEIATSEMVELQLVNAIAPFVLCNRLINIMKRDTTGLKHVVNVSAMEGKFLRFSKGSRHPHTNMAKAALNMLTHTAAEDLALLGIFMNAVDTGWVTDEDPAKLAQERQTRHDFQPPLDIVDGAARICDPFFYGINSGHHWSGKFLKDYMPIDW